MIPSSYAWPNCCRYEQHRKWHSHGISHVGGSWSVSCVVGFLFIIIIIILVFGDVKTMEMMICEFGEHMEICVDVS